MLLVAVRSFPKQFSYFKISLLKAQSASSSLFMQIQESHSSQDFSANDHDAESRRPDYNEFTDQELKVAMQKKKLYNLPTRTSTKETMIGSSHIVWIQDSHKSITEIRLFGASL